MGLDTSTLEAAYQAAIDSATSDGLLDDIEAAQANLYLQSYVAALGAQHEIAGKSLASFSMGGKTFTYRQPDTSRSTEASRYKRLLDGLLGRYSPITLLDLSAGRRTDA